MKKFYVIKDAGNGEFFMHNAGMGGITFTKDQKYAKKYSSYWLAVIVSIYLSKETKKKIKVSSIESWSHKVDGLLG